ncbi:MAG: porin [Rhodoferax sp.]
MKKSLIALAVLAASGAAMAQSSVTTYGILDVWFGSKKTDDGKTSLTQTVLESGGVNGSRWGLKGTEDLGGGLKAIFDLQSGIGVDNGASQQGGLLFGRGAWVGLSGGFGSVKFGRIATPYIDVDGASDAMFNSGVSPATVNFKSMYGNYTLRTNNTIAYYSPTFGGFSGAISYGLGEDKTTTQSASSYTSLNLTYAAGPVAVQFGYQKDDKNSAQDDTAVTRLGGSFDFGMAKAKLLYGKVTNMGYVKDAEATEWQLGADVPVSKALTLSASYAKSTDNAVAGDAKRSGFGFAGAYTLSKRTFLYAAASWNKTEKTGMADAKTDIFALGMQHRF